MVILIIAMKVIPKKCCEEAADLKIWRRRFEVD
jgi:hypothetical protein